MVEISITYIDEGSVGPFLVTIHYGNGHHMAEEFSLMKDAVRYVTDQLEKRFSS